MRRAVYMRDGNVTTTARFYDTEEEKARVGTGYYMGVIIMLMVFLGYVYIKLF